MSYFGFEPSKMDSRGLRPRTNDETMKKPQRDPTMTPRTICGKRQSPINCSASKTVKRSESRLNHRGMHHHPECIVKANKEHCRRAANAANPGHTAPTDRKKPPLFERELFTDRPCSKMIRSRAFGSEKPTVWIAPITRPKNRVTRLSNPMDRMMQVSIRKSEYDPHVAQTHNSPRPIYARVIIRC